jgi:hypothetical protein
MSRQRFPARADWIREMERVERRKAVAESKRRRVPVEQRSRADCLDVAARCGIPGRITDRNRGFLRAAGFLSREGDH